MLKYLLDYAGKKPVQFHMPGHKGPEIFKRYGYGHVLDKLVDIDITEITGTDNLFQAEGIIKGVQDKYQKLYEVKRSYLQINGTSGGILASVLASVSPGGKLIMARNCHKSVFNALTLGNISPVYVRPELDEQHGIMGAIDPDDIKTALSDNPDAEAVILPSPNYYGVCSDIEKISKIVHDAGKILIVDQAHGAHLKFFHRFGLGENMPKAAEDCGADLVLNSIHKTLASLTQSALLNLNSDRANRYILEDKLQVIESTSPSYILMSFLEINAMILEDHGHEALKEWRDNLDYFYHESKSIDHLKVMDGKFGSEASFDRTKINLSLGDLGIDGAQFEQYLMEYDIFTELHTGDLLMFMTGIGTSRSDMNRALTAIKEIIIKADTGKISRLPKKQKILIPEAETLHPIPKQREYVNLDDTNGKVCASSIIPYPPGIPLVCPGEEITSEIIDYVKSLRESGEKVIGVNDRNQVPIGR